MAQFASCRGRNGRGPAFFCDIDLGVRTTSASGCAGGLVGMALIRLTRTVIGVAHQSRTRLGLSASLSKVLRSTFEAYLSNRGLTPRTLTP